MPFLLRPHLSSPVTRSEQASLKPSLSDASWPQLQGGSPPHRSKTKPSRFVPLPLSDGCGSPVRVSKDAALPNRSKGVLCQRASGKKQAVGMVCGSSREALNGARAFFSLLPVVSNSHQARLETACFVKASQK